MKAARRSAARKSRKSTKATKASASIRRPTARPQRKLRRRLPRENAAARQARALRLLARLQTTYPDATTALRHGSAYELLVATILSAQCTDERVNKVTPDLFRRWPDARALAVADPGELEAAIRSTGFFRNKTKSLLGMSRIVRDELGGQISDTMDALLRLPGVARKTANCVLGTWFRKNEGIVVDTHVGRIAERLGLLTSGRHSKDAERIERDLMALFPRPSWTQLSHALILHGRSVCTARQPKCAACTLAGTCPSAGRLG